MAAPNSMTVAQLIDTLSNYPNDSTVLLTSGSISVISWASLYVESEEIMNEGN